jgi:CRISPR-associated protein Csc1
VDSQEIPAAAIQAQSGTYLCEHPLNPLDLAASQQLHLYNRVVMPPTSLVSQAQLSGDYWRIDCALLRERDPYLPKMLNLPRGCSYGAEVLRHVS